MVGGSGSEVGSALGGSGMLVGSADVLGSLLGSAPGGSGILLGSADVEGSPLGSGSLFGSCVGSGTAESEAAAAVAPFSKITGKLRHFAVNWRGRQPKPTHDVPFTTIMISISF